jgi:hypothetical protein
VTPQGPMLSCPPYLFVDAPKRFVCIPKPSRQSPIHSLVSISTAFAAAPAPSGATTPTMSSRFGSLRWMRPRTRPSPPPSPTPSPAAIPATPRPCLRGRHGSIRRRPLGLDLRPRRHRRRDRCHDRHRGVGPRS